ncbi:dTDP-4-dehydrorhamnose reductase [Vibrio splendidus]|uniref:dTDP-4-dehydrorhamnose reductase n=1 Tax=Vibrio splendidus TaxID=29497 RepID=UPI000C848491|nr:dTDP-4-dehydrorhamnose reductase [Vibrio splendidus]PMI77437.1 dTDP-4-dehydrorhamnose reductase [Vibrio splendidus]
MKPSNKTRVLITGANGQVGSCLVKQLPSRSDVELVALDKSELDISNQPEVEKLVLDFRPNFIINAAAYTAVDTAEDEVNAAYEINEKGPKYLAQAVKDVDAVILHISTDYVFEGNKVGSYLETDPTNPQGVYGSSKLAGELTVSEATDKHIILRTAWVFGEQGNNFVKTMLKLAKDRDTLSIVADQFGGPTYAGDIANTLIKIMDSVITGENVEYGTYHYSGMPYVSWFQFADCIFTNAVEQGILTKSPELTSIVTEQYPTPAKRPPNSKLDLMKIKTNFNIQASDWKKAISDLSLYKG